MGLTASEWAGKEAKGKSEILETPSAPPGGNERTGRGP